MSFINPKDFDRVELTGTTNAVADTSSKFRHAKGKAPWAWFPLEGEVYVPRQGIGPNEIDVRSRRVSEPFRILLVFEG